MSSLTVTQAGAVGITITQPDTGAAITLAPGGGVAVTVAVPGSIAGPAGPAGPTCSTFVFTQAVPADAWVIRHNLNCYPSVTVIDSSARVVEGDVTYDAADQITVTFCGAFAGVAYLN